MTDTVEYAEKTPDDPQPWAELGLTEQEYATIRGILGRRPTTAELAMYSVMWSEHCSYKSSKVHLRQFAEKAPATDRLLVGIGENAGVVDVGDGWAVTFKIESHNHPSYVEPYQGAATGVGGIVRDIMAMGARPVAVLDPLRFGPADGGYGNCLGLPTIGGEVVFDPCYAGNPLVNALCVGVVRADRIQRAHASGSGNKVVLFGAKTGRDGIGGVSVLASTTFEDTGRPAKRPSVQVGDPFAEKVLIECCLELYDRGLVLGIQDLGGAGLSCATTELASAGDGGMRIELDRVPLREPSMTPEEVLASESQERMCAVVERSAVDDFLAVCAKWDVLATVLGEVTDTGRLEVYWHGDLVVDVPPRTVAHSGPVYDRPRRRPVDLDSLRASTPDVLPRPSTSDELRATLLQLAATPNLASKRWVTDQYDRYVQGNTVLAQPEDAGVVRIDEVSGRGVAVSTDGNGRYTRLDPYAGAQLALVEAYRNVASTGATPIAVTNCLNFGSPEDPEVMWQFAEAVRGLADACAVLGTPVTGGNVSFYNSTGDTAIHPTPIVGVLGVLDDVTRRTPVGFPAGGGTILLLGDTRDEFGGSEWAHAMHGHLGGRPPRVDLDRERALADVLVAAGEQRLLAAAHDLSDGGLAQAVVESSLRAGVGARVTVPDGLDPFVALFAESAGRAILVAPDAAAERRIADLCAARGLPCTRIGEVTPGTAAVELTGLFTVPLAELREAHEATLPKLFD